MREVIDSTGLASIVCCVDGRNDLSLVSDLADISFCPRTADPTIQALVTAVLPTGPGADLVRHVGTVLPSMLLDRLNQSPKQRFADDTASRKA